MARLRTFLILLLLGAAAALVLSPASSRDPVTGRWTLGLFDPTDEEEVRQGESCAASFVAENDGAYPDADLQERLGKIVRRLGSRSHRPDLPYRFTLLNSSVPNAFALPGGQVFLTRGLLVRLEEEAQFAVVMGHEVGHVNHRHSVRAMNDALVVGLGTTLLRGAAKEERDREAAAGLATLGGGLLLLKFSREQELEADDRGIEYAFRCGYDPRRGVEVFRTFARARREAGAAGGPLASWISSHPLDEERIENLQAKLGRLHPSLGGTGPVPGTIVTTREWGEGLARLREAHRGYERLDRARAAAARALEARDPAGARAALREVEEAGRALPGHALFPAVEGAILLGLGDRDAARERLSRAAALAPGLFLARERLATLELDAGRPAEAALHAGVAAKLAPASAGTRLLLGRALEAGGRSAEARGAYEDAVRLAAAGSDAERLAARRLASLEASPPAARKPRK
jgi:predicted Zn-dependent protease